MNVFRDCRAWQIIFQKNVTAEFLNIISISENCAMNSSKKRLHISFFTKISPLHFHMPMDRCRKLLKEDWIITM